MDPRPPSDPLIVVTTAEPELLDHALSVVAAAGLEAEVVSDPGGLRGLWGSAAMVLVGVDQAGAVAELGLGRRVEVYLLAEAAAAPEAYQWSMPLGAAVVVVPGNVRWLSSAIADLLRRPTGAGRSVCVTGGSGGVGTSTLAAAVAFAAARAGARSVLVDLDPTGGGLDLLVGAERLDGWRWSRLAAARGHLSTVGDQLPCVDGVEVLSMDRGAPGGRPDVEARRAVLGSITTSHAVSVLDVPRDLGGTELAAPASSAWLLVVRSDLRGVAAGRERADELADAGVRPGLVVRTGRTRLLDPASVAEGIGLDLRGVLPDEPGLAVAAERGDPPGRSGRSPLGQLARQLVDELAYAEVGLGDEVAV